MAGIHRSPLLAVCLLITPVLGGCDDAPDTAPPASPVSFNQDVRPILEHKCIACPPHMRGDTLGIYYCFWDIYHSALSFAIILSPSLIIIGSLRLFL